LLKLGTLSEDSARDLISALASVSPTLSPKGLASKLGAAVKSISAEDLADLAAALIALSSVRVVNKIPVPQFVEEVCESFATGKPPQVPEGVALRSRLTGLLQAEPLMLSAKASTLQREHTNVLFDARLVTDIRPVFTDGPEAVPGAMIVHMLKFSYIHDNQSKEFFVALDDEDLMKLQKVISRAEAKSKTLRGIIAKAGLIDLEEK